MLLKCIAIIHFYISRGDWAAPRPNVTQEQRTDTSCLFAPVSPFQKYLLAYDTVHGRFRGTIEVNEKGHLVVDGHEITVWSEYVPRCVFVCASDAHLVCGLAGVLLFLAPAVALGLGLR